MRNPFRRTKKTPEFFEKFVLNIVIGNGGEKHDVRVTVEYGNPRAAISALAKLGDPRYYVPIAHEIGANTAPDHHDHVHRRPTEDEAAAVQSAVSGDATGGYL